MITDTNPSPTMKPTWIALAVLALGLPIHTEGKEDSSQKKKEDLEKQFARKDKDHDKMVSKDEFLKSEKDKPKAEQLFFKKDHDGDRSLTLVEFCSSGEKKKKKK